MQKGLLNSPSDGNTGDAISYAQQNGNNMINKLPKDVQDKIKATSREIESINNNKFINSGGNPVNISADISTGGRINNGTGCTIWGMVWGDNLSWWSYEAQVYDENGPVGPPIILGGRG